MLCSGFVWFLCLIEGSGQTSFCDETMPYIEGHCEYSALSLLRQREGNVLSPFLSCHTEPWGPGLCRMRALHQGILVPHKPRALPCLLWGHDHMPFVYFCYESFWTDTEVCSSPCWKIFFFLEKCCWLGLVCYLSKCDSWLIFTCVCLLQTLINPFCKDKLWLMHILKIYT